MNPLIIHSTQSCLSSWATLLTDAQTITFINGWVWVYCNGSKRVAGVSNVRHWTIELSRRMKLQLIGVVITQYNYATYQAHNAQNFVRFKNHYYWSLTSPDWCTSNLSLVSPFSSIFPSSFHWDQSIHKSAAYADRHKYHPIILTIIIWSLTFFTLTS